MTRLRADILLFIAAIIWGAAFVAQKDAMNHMGPLGYVAARFALSFFCVLPFALRERKKASLTAAKDIYPILSLLCFVFTCGVALQQEGLVHTTVTSAGFLTGIYVLFVPLIGLAFYKTKIQLWTLPAAILSVAGAWFLSRGIVSAPAGFNIGDAMVLGCAICFAFHVVLVGRVMEKSPAPLQLSCLQYGTAAIVCGILSFAFENNTWQGVQDAGIAILYAGILSGGIAYTLQVVAQQYTPASDTAVILSSEAVFAAIFGFLLAGDRLSGAGILGCALITAGILVVELGPLMRRNRAPNTPA